MTFRHPSSFGKRTGRSGSWLNPAGVFLSPCVSLVNAQSGRTTVYSFSVLLIQRQCDSEFLGQAPEVRHR